QVASGCRCAPTFGSRVDGEYAHCYLRLPTGAAEALVAPLQLDAFHAGGAAPHRAHLLFGEADDHAELRRDHHLALAVGAARRDDHVAVLEADRLDTAGARVRERFQLGLLHLALLGREEDVAARPEVAHGHARGDRLALAEP